MDVMSELVKACTMSHGQNNENASLLLHVPSQRASGKNECNLALDLDWTHFLLHHTILP